MFAIKNLFTAMRLFFHANRGRFKSLQGCIRVDDKATPAITQKSLDPLPFLQQENTLLVCSCEIVNNMQQPSFTKQFLMS